MRMSTAVHERQRERLPAGLMSEGHARRHGREDAKVRLRNGNGVPGHEAGALANGRPQTGAWGVWWAPQDLNLRPSDYESPALTD